MGPGRQARAPRPIDASAVDGVARYGDSKISSTNIARSISNNDANSATATRRHCWRGIPDSIVGNQAGARFNLRVQLAKWRSYLIEPADRSRAHRSDLFPDMSINAASGGTSVAQLRVKHRRLRDTASAQSSDNKWGREERFCQVLAPKEICANRECATYRECARRKRRIMVRFAYIAAAMSSGVRKAAAACQSREYYLAIPRQDQAQTQNVQICCGSHMGARHTGRAPKVLTGRRVDWPKSSKRCWPLRT